MAYFRMRDGSEVADPRLGRLPEFDPKSKKFSVRAFLDPQLPLRSYTWSIPEDDILDQGNEGSCVGHGYAHEVSARPVKFQMTSTDALWIYRRGQVLDIWFGEDYDGTSVLAGAKACVELGHYKEYRWAFTEQEMAHSVGYAGPVVIGVNWYSGMFNPDQNGYLRPDGFLAGGHCVMVNSFSARLNRYQIVNSWGLSWGNRGRAYITRKDMARLIEEDGECCLPLRTKLFRET